MQPCGNCRHLLRCFPRILSTCAICPNLFNVKAKRSSLNGIKRQGGGRGKGRIRVMQSIHIMQTARIEQG